MKIIKNDKVIVYGGTSSSEEQLQQNVVHLLNDLYVFNINQRLWEQPEVGGNFPPPRINMCYSVNFPQPAMRSGELLLIGGSEEVTFKNIYVEMKIYVLTQTQGENWKTSEELSSPLFSRLSEDEDEEERMQEMTTVHLTDKEILEEEFSKAEAMIHRLKQEVSEMEVNLKQEKLKNEMMKVNGVKNLERVKTVEQEGKKYIEQKSLEILEQQERKRSNTKIISDLLTALAVKIKHRKFIQARIALIENAIDYTMEFIVHLDRFFSAAIQRTLASPRKLPRLRRQVQRLQRDREAQRRAHADPHQVQSCLRRAGEGRSAHRRVAGESHAAAQRPQHKSR